MTFGLRTAMVFAYCAIVATSNLPTLRELFEFSSQNATASYVLLIPVISFALVYQERGTIFSDVRIDWPAALPLIVPAAVMAVAAALGVTTIADDLPLRVAA